MSMAYYTQLTAALNNFKAVLPKQHLHVAIIGQDSVTDFTSTDRLTFIDLTGKAYDAVVRGLNLCIRQSSRLNDLGKPVVLLLNYYKPECFTMASTVVNVGEEGNATILRNQVDQDYSPGLIISKPVYYRWLMGITE